MNKSQLIRLNCRECNGSPKEVTLCTAVLCMFWPYRFGYSMKDKRFMQRMAKASKNYPKEYKEMAELIRERLSEQPITAENTQIRMFFERNLND